MSRIGLQLGFVGALVTGLPDIVVAVEPAATAIAQIAPAELAARAAATARMEGI